MIDFNTYRKMHPGAVAFKRTKGGANELPTSAIDQDEIPDGNFPLLLPAHTYGFNLQDKNWGMWLSPRRYFLADDRNSSNFCRAYF